MGLPILELFADPADIGVGDIVEEDADDEGHEDDVEQEAQPDPAVFLGDDAVVGHLVTGQGALVQLALVPVGGDGVGGVGVFGHRHRGQVGVTSEGVAHGVGQVQDGLGGGVGGLAPEDAVDTAERHAGGIGELLVRPAQIVLIVFDSGDDFCDSHGRFPSFQTWYAETKAAY